MPEINLDNCIKCLKCVNDCPADAIDINKGHIADTCIKCGHCVAICPERTIEPSNGSLKPLSSVSVSSADFQNLSSNIRTCRNFSSQAIEDNKIELLIENMKHYPSASNTRPIEINYVKTPELVQSLNDQTAKGLIKMLGFVTSPFMKFILKAIAPKFDTTKLKNYREKFIERQKPNSSQICHHAPGVLLFHAPVVKFGMASADAYIWATYTSIFAQTLGLSTCFNGFIVKGMERSSKMRKEFGIPKNHQIYASLLIGYSNVKYFNEAGREQPKKRII